ncbi:MAG: ribokinase [Spirochaetes bacterium]|jgi:ribokinase|nr:ribokinase [Spirochaetota bacterium]
MAAQFCVIGSINMDLVAGVDHFPRPGESRIGHSFGTYPGGKGANQATALARLGAAVMMAGRVGKDTFGEDYLESFRKEGVDLSLVQVDANAATGVAVIEVDDTGENHIVVVPGANMTLGESYVNENATAIAKADICLFQLEVPAEANRAGMALARKAGRTTILDPAPAPREAIPEKILSQADYVTPNETEAQFITGVEVSNAASAERAARALQKQGARVVIIKAGAHGAYIADDNGVRHVEGFSVKAVDTTAAGDAFNAGLAYALGTGKPLYDAVRYANAVGALACTRLGAQSALPRREEVESLLRA